MNADRYRSSTMARRWGARLRRLIAVGVIVGTGTASAACLGVSRQDEIEMGRSYARQLAEELPLVEDDEIRAPIRELGEELARRSSRPDMPYEFHVVNTDAVNAFAVPGGFIYLNRGLLAEAEDMAQIAGVLAHEVGHVVGRHSAEQIEEARKASLGYGLVSVLLGRPEGVAALGIDVGANLYFARHSRADEAEADSMAVAMMVGSGWDPRGLVGFFRILLEERERKPGALEALFTSHPLTEERIRSVERMIGEIPDERLAGLRSDGPAFASLQRALDALPPPPEEFRVRKDDGGGDR